MIPKNSAFFQSFLYLFFSCVFTTSVFFGLQAIKNRQVSNQKYLIQKILLKGEGGDLLTGDLIAEMLDLNISNPLSFFEFESKKAEQELKKIGIFRSVKLEKKRPDSLVVLYQLFEPIAVVQDQSNTLLNEEGIVMPYQPYFSLKKLPKVIIGENLSWGEKVLTEKWLYIERAIALDENIVMIDLRFCFEGKKQKKELVFEVARQGSYDWVRLNPSDFEEEWQKYLSIKPILPPIAQIVELRYKDMALYEKKNES